MTIDEPIEESDVKGLLRDVLAKENLQDAKIVFQRGSKVGDGFLGITNAIEIKKGNRELKLFAKAAPKNENLRKTLCSREVFLKEIGFYKEILPIYNDFLLKQTGKPLNLTAKCYATKSEAPKEMLVFDNLVQQGYEMFAKDKFLNEEHVLLILRSYAKFHGVCYAIKEKCPEKFVKICENIVYDINDLFKRFEFLNILNGCRKTLKDHNNGMIDKGILDKLDDIIDGCYDFLQSSVMYEDKHKIFVHGDCWMNNMLFKYKENGKSPIEMKLIDFQLNRINLPVFDLSYFFYCSAASVENLAKLDYYLEYYHEHLCDFLQNLGCDGEIIYPLKMFKEHWKKFSRFGLMMSLYLTKVMLSQGEETPNMAERINAGADHGDTFHVELDNNDAYIERMRNILLHFTNNKFM